MRLPRWARSRSKADPVTTLEEEWAAEQGDEYVMPFDEAMGALAAADGRDGRFARSFAMATKLNDGYGEDRVNRAERRRMARQTRGHGRG